MLKEFEKREKGKRDLVRETLVKVSLLYWTLSFISLSFSDGFLGFAGGETPFSRHFVGIQEAEEGQDTRKTISNAFFWHPRGRGRGRAR